MTKYLDEDIFLLVSTSPEATGWASNPKHPRRSLKASSLNTKNGHSGTTDYEIPFFSEVESWSDLDERKANKSDIKMTF